VKQNTFDGEVILHHVTNDTHSFLYELALFGINISITKHVVMLWIVAAFTIALSLYATRSYRNNIKSGPKGISHLYEILIEFIKSDIVIPNIGKEKYKSWTPLIATFFLFILLANLLGMIPFFEKIPGVAGSSTITGNMGVTLALSSITFFSIIIAGTLKHGFIGHWKNMIPSGVPAPVLIILVPVEIMGMFIKPIALFLRLGANMTAGHIGIVAIFGIPMILSQTYSTEIAFSIGIISVVLNVAIYFLEILVCLVQAYVFSLLSAVFIGMAIHAHH
jgi:F-type H+-transporting ATPase subunit a